MCSVIKHTRTHRRALSALLCGTLLFVCVSYTGELHHSALRCRCPFSFVGFIHIHRRATHHSALLCSSTRSNYMHVREQVCARVRLMYVLEHTSCVCLSTHACNKMRNFFSFRRITEYLRSLGLLQTEMEKKYIAHLCMCEE